MKTTRRGFFGALAGMLAAPFVAKAAPKLLGPQYQFGQAEPDFKLRITGLYDPEKDEYTNRYDILPTRISPLFKPEWACRIEG